ncbi:MAG: hypothetical protein P4M12_01155 [Gammaproteobacteria bacterium]|nr:hypothetical protein [Gammaproteobacteria bacterium]
MKKYFFILAFMLFLSGCHSSYHYTYLPPPDGKAEMCIVNCYHCKKNCVQMCEVRRDHCKIRGGIDAVDRYQYYEVQRHARNLPNKTFINDFDDSACSCNFSCCHCVEKYNACYRACGGVVIMTKFKSSIEQPFFAH